MRYGRGWGAGYLGVAAMAIAPFYRSRFNPRMASAPPLLYPFRFRNPLTGKWVRARYKASRSEIEKRYAEWEITGAGEMRQCIGGSFSPHGKLIAHEDLKRLSEPPLEFHPHLETEPAMHAVEVFLVCLFLRRYVTYCARHGRYAQMNGAAELFREIRAVVPLRSM